VIGMAVDADRWLQLRATVPPIELWSVALDARFGQVIGLRALDESFRRFEAECFSLHGLTADGELRTFRTVLHTPPFDPSWLAER